MPDPEAVDLDAVVEELTRRAEGHRRDGTFPAGIDDQLRREYEARLHHVLETGSPDRLRTLRHEAYLTGPFELRPYTGTSRAKQAASRAVEKAVGYALVDILGQLNRYREAVDRVFGAVLETVEPRATALEQEVIELRERVQRLEAASGIGEDAALLDRIDDLQRRVDRRGFAPWFDGAEFEKAFRGDQQDYQDRYAPVVHRFEGHGPVLDVGCGRGEVMAMLRHQGIETSGVDLDTDAVDEAVAQGLDATAGDALDHLEALPDESLGGVVCIQVVEHLGPQGVLDFVSLCARKVRPGGLVFAETINPQSLCVYANAMYVDPTHTQPIHPEYLEFLFSKAGFSSTTIEYRSPVPEPQQLPRPDGDAELVAVVDRLNGLLYGPQDYGVVSTR